MARVRKAAPARISAIMQYRRVAPISDSRKVAQFSERCTADSASEPTTPTAAASVAVAKPCRSTQHRADQQHHRDQVARLVQLLA
jgi:hypothetical protein